MELWSARSVMLVRPLDQPWPRMGAPADCFCWKGKSQVQCLWQSSAQSRCYLMSSGTVQKSAFRLRTLHKQDVIAICQETQLFFRTRLSSGSTVTFSLFFFLCNAFGKITRASQTSLPAVSCVFLEDGSEKLEEIVSIIRTDLISTTLSQWEVANTLFNNILPIWDSACVLWLM